MTSEAAPYNSCFHLVLRGGDIATSFHPVRWAAVLAFALPFVLGATAIVARLCGNQELARTYYRGLRFVGALECIAVVLLAIAGFTYEQRARKREAAQFKPPGELVDVGGYRLHLYCTGTGGSTVILEHGHRANYLDWYLVQPNISAFTRVCSFDRAGHGWSDVSPQRRLPSVMAEELHTLLHASGERPPYILVGHSFGGLEAVTFAHKFRDEVAAVVLVDSPHPDVLRRASLRGRLWARVMQLTLPFGLPRWRGWCESGPQDVLAIKRALACRPQNIEAILREDAAFPAAADEIRAITTVGSIPVVVIARDPAKGQNSVLQSRHAQQQQALAKISTNSIFITAKGSGHDVPLARPEVIVNAVKTLITPLAQADNRETP